MNGESASTILIVDDEVRLRRFIQRTLEIEGFSVLEAGTAAQGLEICQSHLGVIDLAIIDMVLPGGVSGLDLAAELGRQKPVLRILYISGYGASIAIESMIQRSADAVLVKPFTAQTLVERVHRLLGNASQAGFA